MSVTLETLTLDFEANFSEFDQQLDRASARARIKAREIEGLKIVPRVDLKPLHELNKLLDLKQKHLLVTQRVFESNPLKVAVDNSALSILNGFRELPREVRIKATFEGHSSQAHSAVNAIKTVADILRDIRKNTKQEGILTKTIGGVLNTTVGNTFRGIFLNLGEQFAQTATREYRKTESGKKATETTRKVARRAADTGASSAGQYSEIFFGGSRKKGNAVETMANDILTFVENIVDPHLLNDKATKIRRKFFDVITKLESEQYNIAEVMLELSTAIHSLSPRLINNAALRTTQAVSSPLKIQKEYQNAKVARFVESFVSDLEKARRVLAKNPEAKKIEDAENVYISISGHERKKGTASQQTSEMLRPFFDEKTVFLEVKSTYTDRYQDDPKSDLYDTLKAILEPLGVPMTGDIKSNLSNLEIEMTSAFKGMNPDAIKTAIIKESVKTLFPNKNIRIVGFSGGGYPAEQAVSISEATGDKETKGYAVGTPFFGLTNTASKENFISGIGYSDPLTALFDKNFIDYPPEAIAQLKKAMVAKGFPQEVIDMAFIQPSENMNFFDGSIKHDFQSYLGNDESYDLMQNFLPGMLPRKQKIDTKNIDPDLKKKYQDLVSELSEADDFLFGVGNIRKVIAKIGRSIRFLDPKDMPEGLKSISKILDKPKAERTNKENKIIDKYIGDVTEQFLKNLNSFEEQLEGLLGANAISLANEVAKKRGIKIVQSHEIDFLEQSLTRETDPAKMSELTQKIASDKAELAKLKPIQDAMRQLVDDWFKNSNFKQNLEAKKKAANEVLDKAAIEKIESYNLDIQKLKPVEKAALGSYVSKREKDDIAFLKGLDIYRNRGTSNIEAYKSFFDYNDPKGKIDFEMKGFRDYVSKPNAAALKETEFGNLAQKYDRLLENIQAALARFVATGEEIPEEFLNAAERILKSSDKFADIDFPDLISSSSLKSPSNYFKGLAEGAKRLTGGNNLALSEYEISQLELLNQKIAKKNNKNPKAQKIPLVDVNDTVKLGTGWNGTAVLERQTGRVIKFAAGDSDPLTNATNIIQKEIPFTKPLLDLLRQFIPQTGVAERLPLEAANVDLAAQLGLASTPPHRQIKGFVMMQLEEGQALAKAAESLKGKDPKAIIDFIEGIVKAGQLIAKFHQVGYVHGDLHLNNVIAKEDGSVAPIDFGTMKKLPETGKERNRAIASDVKKAINNSRWLLEDMGISINPTLLAEAYRRGVRGDSVSGDDLYNKYQNNLINQKAQAPSNKTKIKLEEQTLNPEVPLELKQPQVKFTTEVVNRLDKIIALLQGWGTGNNDGRDGNTGNGSGRNGGGGDDNGGNSGNSPTSETELVKVGAVNEASKSSVAGTTTTNNKSSGLTLSRRELREKFQVDYENLKKSIESLSTIQDPTELSDRVIKIQEFFDDFESRLNKAKTQHDDVSIENGAVTGYKGQLTQSRKRFDELMGGIDYAPIMRTVLTKGLDSVKNLFEIFAKGAVNKGSNAYKKAEEIEKAFMPNGSLGQLIKGITQATAIGAVTINLPGIEQLVHVVDAATQGIIHGNADAIAKDLLAELHRLTPEAFKEISDFLVKLPKVGDVFARAISSSAELFTHTISSSISNISETLAHAGELGVGALGGKSVLEAGAKSLQQWADPWLEEGNNQNLLDKIQDHQIAADVVLSTEKAKEDLEKLGTQIQVELELEQLKAAQPLIKPSPKVGLMNVNDLKLDPKRFQYKGMQVNEGGSTGSLADIKKYDPERAGYIQVWQDPEDKQYYVINGHNRYDAAKRHGQTEIGVMEIEAQSAKEARAKGALQNIGEGNGTALDAAKFFRASNITSKEQALELGLSLKKAIAEQGLGMAKLPPDLFDLVVQNQMPTERASLIGGSGLSQQKMLELYKQIEKYKKINNETISELIDNLKMAETQTVSLFNLFGESEEEQSLAILRASLQSSVSSRLKADKRDFGFVSKSGRAERLTEAGNTIDVDESANRSKTAASALSVFDRLKNMAGGVDRLLNIATKRLADGESKKVVEAQLYKQIAPLLAEIAQKPSAIALNDEGIAALQIQSKTSNPQDAIAKTIAHFNVDTDSDAGKGLQKAADVAGKHWGKTSSDIVRQYGILDKEAKKHGYSIQKALSKGSPGLLTNIEGHWENAEEKLKNNLKGIESQALKSGKAIELIFTQGFNGIDFIEKRFKISADRSQHHWAKTAIEILKQFDILAAAAAEKGYDIQRFISEGSPGTTQRIRLYWLKTTKAIVENLSELASTSSLAGTSIEKGLSSGLNNVEKAIEKTQNKLIAIETEHNQKPHVEKKQRKEKQQQLELLEISHIVDTANLEQLSANIQESLKQARKDNFNHGITKTPYPLKERVPLPENKLVNFVFKLNTKSQKLADFLMNPVANLSNNLGNIGKSLTAPVVNLSDNLGNIGESLVESFKKADTWIRSVGDRVMDLKSKARDFLSGSNSKEAEKNDTSAVEELARDLGKSIRQVYNSTGFILENLSVPDVIPRSLEAFAEGFLGIESAAGLAKKQLYAIATAGALVLFGKQIVDTLVHLAQFQMQIDGIDKKLRAVGEQPVTDIFDEFGEAANRAGARVTAFADSYAGMVASLKGRVTNHKELVFDLAIGLSDRGVEGEAQDLTLKALQQMAGKGVVSMEELRQQVGDYLPNALGIAASAMGLTEKQMIALVGSGQLLASEFLPKLAKELQVTGEQQTSLTKEVVRFQNTLDEIKFDAASIIPFKQGMQLLNWALEKTEAIVKPLFVALGVAGAALLANLAVQAVIAAAKIQMVGQALMWTWKMLMPLLLSTAALFAIAKAWDLVMVGSANSARNLNKELQKLASEGLKDVKEELTGYKSDNPFVLTQKAKFREETVNRDAIASGLNSLIQLDFKFRARTDDAEIQRVSEDLASDIEKAKNMAYKIANRETFGISQKEALMMQQEVDKFNEGIDSRLNSSFNPSEMEAALKDIDTRRKLAERELEKGANVEQYASIMLELDIRENEIRKSLNKVKQIVIDNTPTLQVQIEARTLQQNLGNNLETFNTNAEIELYERLAKAKASERLAEAQARKLSVASRREELKLIEAANQKNLQQVGLLNDSQKERLAGLLGTDDFTKITFNQVEKARETLAIEEESGVTPDKALKESVERLGALATNTARVNKIKSEEAQYNYETIKIIKALNIELANLKIERLQKILEVRELTRDLNKSLSGDNEQLFSAKQELRSNTAQLARSIFDQKEAYDQAIIGINDFTYSLTSSTKELARRLTQMGRDMYTAVVGSMSSYLGAAEIEDILGFGKIRELITKAAGITSSDQRPQIQAEIESETRNYSNSTRDQKKNQVRMNLDLDRAVFDLQGQQNELGRRRRFNPEDTEIDLERLKLRVLELPNTIAQKNRDIDGANQAAKEYGVTGYVPPIDVPLPDLSQFKTPQEVTAAINNIYAELQKANQETIDLYGRIKTEGNAAINRALADSRSAFENNMQSKHQLLEAEGDRVSQGYELLGRESEGLFFALNQGLEKQILGLKAKGLEARKAISDLFTNSGISLNRETIVNTIIETKTQEIDSQISSLTQVREQMKKYLEVENSDDLLKLLASDRNLNNIDPEFREELIGKIKAIASTDDFKSVLSLIEGQNGDYTQLIGILGSKKEELVNGTIELFNRKGDRRLQDIDLDFAQEQFNGKYNLTDIEKQKIQVEIDASKASIELSRQMEDLVGELPSEAIDEIRIKLERLNKIKFDRLRKEATLTFKMIQSAKDAMESAFSSIFTGFGDALFKGIGNEDEIEKLKINAEYAEKLREVQDKYADDPDQLGKASERLEMLNNVKLDKVKQEFNAFHNIVGVVKNAILEFSKAMVAALAQVAAKAVATFIITSALGGGKPSFSGLNKAPKGFSLGGEVENFALGGAISDGGIRRAMSREGTGAVVVVAHKGEQLLSARTGDAQLFRALERSGRWREIKQQHHVPNYSMGGSVGSSRASGSYSNNGGSSKGNVTINNNYDVRVQGENQMRKTSSQLIAEADARNKRIAARNG